MFPASSGGGSKIVKLWENPSPASTYSTGTMDANTSGYDLYMVIFATYTNGPVSSVIGRVGEGVRMCYSAASNSGADTADRDVTYTSSSVLTVGQAERSTGTGSKTNPNTILIPLVVYGIKL